MGQSSPSQITDARALKALSNPTRLRILTILRTEGPQTVGQLAGCIDQAPGSISYHLSQLSAVHLVEKTKPTTGCDKRTSWWKAVDDSLMLSPRHFDHATEEAFGRASLAAYSDAYARFTASGIDLAGDCKNEPLQHDAILTLTDKEADALKEELESVLEKWIRIQDGREQASNTNKYAFILLGFPWIP